MTLRQYGINIGLAILYVWTFVRCYTEFLNRHFEYVGFTLFPRDFEFLALSMAIAVAPILLYRGFRALSSFLSVFIYVVLYVPIIITFALGSVSPIGEIILIETVFLGGMCLLFLSDHIIIRNPVSLQSGWNLLRVVLVLTVVSTVYMLVVYRGNLKFVSFGEAVYEQRSATAELGTDVVTRYLSSWLSTVLVPLSLAYGLVAKKRAFLLAGLAACVTIYMATAAKYMILLPLVYWGFYVMMSRGRLGAIYPMLTGTLIVSLAALLAVSTPGTVMFLVSSLVMFRTIGNGGQLTMAYYDFFSFHPQTDFSHVSLIKYFVHPYPYGSDGVGQVIGKYYWGEEANANASFWATDGIASMGLAGVPVASVGCAVLFIAMNTVTRGYNGLMVALCFIPYIIMLLNGSLFTSFWSGGAFFLLLFFLFNRRDEPGAEAAARPAADMG